MTQLLDRSGRGQSQGPPFAGLPAAEGDRPGRRSRISQNGAAELIGSAVAAFAVVWLAFSVAGVAAPFGFVVSWYGTSVTLYGVLCWRLHGVLAMKERLASVMVYSGAFVALFSLLVVMWDVVVLKGGSVVFADFPHFFVADMTNLTANAPVTAVGVGPAIVGTLEQVGLAALFTVPIGILTATFLADARGLFPRIVGSVVDAMTGSPAIIAGLFVYLFWVAPRTTNGKSGFAAALALSVMMLPMVTRAAQEVITVVPGSLREAALALGAPEWRVALRVVLPTARSGLANAIILAIARVTGETAPILFDVGGNSRYNWNPFHGQQDNLAFRIYQLIFQPGVNTTRDAWGAALVLIIVVFALFLLARIAGGSSPGRRRIRLPFRSPL